MFGLIISLFYLALFITKCVTHSQKSSLPCDGNISLNLVLSTIMDIVWPVFLVIGLFKHGGFSKVSAPTIETTTTTYSNGHVDVSRKEGTTIVHFGKHAKLQRSVGYCACEILFHLCACRNRFSGIDCAFR